VIGGGLTAIDMATEAAAYYPVQVKNISSGAEIVAKELAKMLWKMYDEEEKL
jgi:NADPH-dependent glutamate synthase beta subunit-like oxidoreductase